jgi:NTE family protein
MARKISQVLIFLIAYSSTFGAITNLTFEGSGIRFFAYIGAIKALEENKKDASIHQLAGTSGGAIIATLFAVGYTSQELEKIAYELNFNQFNDNRWHPIKGMKMLNSQFGYHSGQQLEYWIRKLVYLKTGNGSMTFQELYEQKGKNLIIVTTDLLNNNLLICDKNKMPQMSIATAARASASIPYYYCPVTIDHLGKTSSLATAKYILVDGGLLLNNPIRIFDTLSLNDNTLGLQLISLKTKQSKNEMDDLLDFSLSLYYTTIDKPMSPADQFRTILINDMGITPKVKGLDKNKIKLLIESGYKSTKNWLSR